eukprot:COSAG01_NODE_57505_length_311_cov_765.919811_1_plen_24_part_01
MDHGSWIRSLGLDPSGQHHGHHSK